MTPRYGHERGYVPTNKNDLAKVLAVRYAKQELYNPKYQGRTEEEVRDLLASKFRREFNMKQLYKFYFNPGILRRPKPSKLEQDVERLEKEQNPQQSLF